MHVGLYSLVTKTPLRMAHLCRNMYELIYVVNGVSRNLLIVRTFMELTT